MASPSAPFANRFAPYDDRTQPAMRVEGYRETLVRVPARAPYTRPATLSDITGPLNLAQKLDAGVSDLSRTPSGERAQGQLVRVCGQLLDEDGVPVRGSIIEVWQANAAGRYLHKMDAKSPFPVDPNFSGAGRCVTDAQGRYEYLTIKPGAYPVPSHPERWWRPPHIHLSVFGEGFMSRLVTQMFFPGDPLNAQDRILNSVPDPAGRERMIAQPVPMLELPRADVLGFRHDIVVRGHRATPMGL
ncbi:MAG: protocatechuate 3,4-dioxygenase subunit beta [Betaproteobacteria bacterium]